MFRNVGQYKPDARETPKRKHTEYWTWRKFKIKNISVFLSWTQDIKILNQGAIWNCGKGTGLYWADIRLWGTKGASIRPRCIGTISAWTQYTSTNQSNTEGLIAVLCCSVPFLPVGRFEVPAAMSLNNQSSEMWHCVTGLVYEVPSSWGSNSRNRRQRH
jgi:hypothetical protein